MARFWIGVALLGVFLGLGIWVTVAMDQVHEPISQALEEAAEQALAGDLEGGAALARQAKADWQEYWKGTASVADHGSMDEIDGIFGQLEAYAQAGRQVDFAAYCARLSRLVHAIGEAHGFNWWNLL